MTGTDVARFTHKSVPVIFEPPCISILIIFYYTKLFVLSHFIIFIIQNNHVIVIHTCVDVTT